MHTSRVRILRSGLEQFAARGYHATSTRDIAAGASMQSPSLYAHYASKEAILAELVLLGYQAQNRDLVAALMDSGSSPVEQLRAIVAAHVSGHCRWSLLAAVANNERKHLSPELDAPVEVLAHASLQIASDVLQRGIAAKAFLVPDPEVTLGAIATLGYAVIAWYPAHAETRTPEQVGATYGELVLRMVGAA